MSSMLASVWRLVSRTQAAAVKHRDAEPDEDRVLSLGRPDRIDRVLTGAGFTDVHSQSITVTMVFGRDAVEAADFVFAMGPMRFNLAGAGADEIDRTKGEVVESLRQYEQDGQVRLHVDLWLVHASAGRN